MISSILHMVNLAMVLLVSYFAFLTPTVNEELLIWLVIGLLTMAAGSAIFRGKHSDEIMVKKVPSGELPDNPLEKDIESILSSGKPNKVNIMNLITEENLQKKTEYERQMRLWNKYR